MKFWIISDTHLGHDKLTTEYHIRPEGFEEKILRNLMTHVMDADILIHLGDICIGKDEFWNNAIRDLPGRKWLVRGNHDGKSLTWYLSHGWHFVADQITLDAYGKRICFSHEPVHPKECDGGSRFDINIHGHCHADNHRRADSGFDYQYLIALEHDYRPVTLRSIVEAV